MPNIPHQTFDQPRSEENQNAALDKETASEMMAQNESLYSKLVNSLGGIVWEADGKTFQFTFVSPQAERMLGYPVERWLNEPNFWRNHTHPDDADWCAAYCLDATAQRRDHEFKYRMIAADGRVVWLQDIVSVKIEADESVRLRGIMIDITERKRAEEELRRTSERLQLATRAAGIGIWDWDVVKDELIWDDAMYRLFGIRKEDFSGAYDAWAKSLAPEDFEWANAEVQAALRGEREFAAEFRIVWPDGSVHFIKAASQTFRDEEGRPLRMVGMNYDITERKRAEEELRASEERFSKAFNSSPIRMGIIRLRDGAILDVNDRWLRETGYAREEIIGRPAFELKMWLGEEQQSRLRRLLDEAKPLRDVEYRLVTKTGEQRFTLISAEVVDLGGEPCYLWASNDITERRRAEEELRQSQERFFRAFHASPVAIVLARLEDGRLIEVNETAQRFFGFSREEMIGRTTVELGVWANPDDRLRRVEELERLGSVRDREYQFRTRQGEVLVGLYSSELMEIDGVKCIQTVVQDITERKEVEEQLKTSSRQLRALSESLRKAKEDEGIRIAREIHDELGSALTSLKWSLLRLDKVYSGDGNSDSQSGAREEIDGMVGLVDTTINTVRRIASELRPSVLDDLGLIPAIEWHAQQFQEHTGIVCRFDALIENIELNREQATAVFRIFQEAMTNVLRHASATKVNIIIEEEESEFVLEIKDNGRGIAESERLGIHSLGLLGMRERASSIGGKVEINGIARKGTVLIVRIPIKGDTTA